ncbi:stage III sporulation protein AE [Schnuerera sp. xch1]|uniref:stage III sporulation protein AE n=1 Tax=Schnuerera sp. xch1 TaxID=2874283 RepID=UPI001CBA7A7A|nr:stage III sporulation protein AE [Schnuerera sp. xch1]MBZ2173746.1 stage III sporulation protein AE [Schnuerera sp. xch1]
MIRNKSILLITILFILLSSYYSFSEGTVQDDTETSEEFIEKQLKSLNVEELESVLDDMLKDKKYHFNIDIKEVILSIIKGETSFDIKFLVNEAIKSFFNEILDNLVLISQILVITITCTVLSNLQSSFEKDTVAQLAHYACYMILSMLIINSFTLAFDLGKDTVTQMVNFMQIILPLLLALLTAVGASGTRLIFHPIVVGAVNIIGILIKNLVFPLIFFTFIIGIISNISQKVQFTKLSELMRQIVIVIISASFTVFIGIITIYGMGANIDGVTIRTAKFAVDSFIPIIGKFLSDAVEVVVGSSAILKNGIGMIGLIVLFLICLTPAIKIMVLIFVYKIAAALLQPIASTNIFTCFSEVSKALLLVLVGILSVATMFFITITVIVEAGNTALMFR